MPSTVNQITGGNFQDLDGTLLANGYLIFQLSQDAQANGNTEICAGFKIRIPLDSSGDVVTSPTYSVWPNDVLSPAGTFYTVSAYTSKGQLVWGPNAQNVLSSPSPFPIGDWVPNSASTTIPVVTTYDIGIFLPAQFITNQIVCLVKLERAVNFAGNMVPSTAVVGTNPTGTPVFSLKKNGTQFATLTITSGGVCTYASSGITNFATGDILSVVGPSSVDATLANLGMILSGTTV